VIYYFPTTETIYFQQISPPFLNSYYDIVILIVCILYGNIISLSLQQRHPISLIGKNHYHKFLYEIACYGAAFHYTDEDNLLGSVCIMMPINFQNPLFLTMLSQVVDSIEKHWCHY
jgi:hypothetical protein